MRVEFISPDGPGDPEPFRSMRSECLDNIRRVKTVLGQGGSSL